MAFICQQALAAPAVDAAPAEQKKRDQAQQAPKGDETQTVTVVAKRASEMIDRSVFDVKSEVITPNASVADVLANVPNVSVDLDGKVAIRGNQNVQVFVDGKPSAMFNGQNAGQALNSYPATALKSIEVITTPGAEFGSQGGGGAILNLVTRRERPMSAQGLASISVGPRGQRSASLNGSYATGRLQLEGNGNVMRNVLENRTSASSENDMGNSVWMSHRESSMRSSLTTLLLSPTIRYNLGETDRISAVLNFNKTKSDNNLEAFQRNYRDTPGPYEAYYHNINQRSQYTIYQASLGWERKFSATEELKFDLRNSGSNSDGNTSNHDSYVIAPPTGPRPDSVLRRDVMNRLTELSADYTKRISPVVNLKLGAKLGRSSGQTDASYFNIDPLTGAELIDTSRTSGFRFTEHAQAAYFSPNLRVSEHWTLLPGLRYERVTRHIDYLTPLRSAADGSSRLLPSMHVQYAWGERGATATGAYSRRITRPSPGDLDPIQRYVDDQNYTQGNARLAPMHNEKYELKYSDSWPRVNSTIFLYREQDSPLLGRSIAPVPGSLAVISRAVNFGARTNDGISWNLQAKPSLAWRIDATLGFRHTEQSYLSRQINDDGASYSVENERKLNSKDLQLSGQYSGYLGHSVTLEGTYTGRKLNGPIEMAPSRQAHVSWHWRVTPRLTLITRIRDIFDGNQIRSTTNSGAVRQHFFTETQGRILTVSFNHSFGGVTGDTQVRNNAK